LLRAKSSRGAQLPQHSAEGIGYGAERTLEINSGFQGVAVCIRNKGLTNKVVNNYVDVIIFT
jgi:hypothetical protein